MRFLLTFLTAFACFAVNAQVAADLVFSGGYTIPSLRKERSPDSKHSTDYYLAHGVDLLFDESRTFFPYAGVRISKLRFGSHEYFSNGESLKNGLESIALSGVGGVQYARDVAKHTSMRVVVGAGPYFDLEQGNNMHGTRVNAVAEASVGIKWRFLTLGVKLVKPIASFGHHKSRGIDWGTEGPNDYGVSIAALELKLTPPPPPGDGEHGRPNRPRGRGPAGYEFGRERNTRVELGVAAGPASVKVTDRGGRDSDPAGSGGTVLVTFDVYGDGNKRPVCFAAGARIGADPLGAHISHVLGFQINTAPAKDLGFRLSAMGGPLIYTGESFIKFNLELECSASVLINQRWSVGVKYIQPIEDLTDKYYREPWYGSDYRVRHLLGEVKLRFGRR